MFVQLHSKIISLVKMSVCVFFSPWPHFFSTFLLIWFLNAGSAFYLFSSLKKENHLFFWFYDKNAFLDLDQYYNIYSLMFVDFFSCFLLSSFDRKKVSFAAIMFIKSGSVCVCLCVCIYPRISLTTEPIWSYFTG